MKRFAILFLLAALATAAQQSAQPNAASPPARPAPQTKPSDAEFMQAADEVLQQMSQLLALPIKHPLKKSLRSKDEIRQYLIKEENEDRSEAQRYADQESLEAFGLIPKGFPLDQFMLDVLTDQVAGLYDPKAEEFYIADWTAPDEQRDVMAHELTHALEDQSFHVDPWIKAARPNDDAELARDAVSEGSALVAMIDYSLREDNVSVRDLPDVSGLIRAGAVSEMNNDPKLSKAPPYIRDALLFPYLAGTTFTQQFLKAHSGWKDLHLVFENPPVSTQQILDPGLYLAGTKPVEVTLPEWKGLVPADWKLLEENVMGEFGLAEVLKVLENQESADAMAPAWAGDRYAVFEDTKANSTPLVLRLALDNANDAARFFGVYSQALESKYKTRTAPFSQPDFLQFQMDTGGVFLRCMATTCLVVEGASRETFDKIDGAIGWPPAPAPSPSEGAKTPLSL